MKPIGVWCHTDVRIGASDVLARLPAELSMHGISLRLSTTEVRQGAFGRHARMVPVRWTRGRRAGRGYLEVAPLASDRTQLLLHLGSPAGSLLDAPARELLNALCRRVEGRPSAVVAAVPTSERVPRRRAAAVLAALFVPAAVFGFFALSWSPTAVSVEDRVAEFRAEQAADPAAAAADESPARISRDPAGTAPGDGSGGEAAEDPREQPASAERQTAPAGGPDDQHADSTPVVGGDGLDAAGETGSPGVGGEGPTEDVRLRPPDPGVYRYATTGGDELNVRGSARDYPETTTITVRHDTCGFTERWDVFDERWDVRDWCVEDERRPLVGMTSYREFFGHGQRHRMICDGQPPRASAMEPGVHWEVVCEDGETTATTRVETVGQVPIDVDGERLDTLHLQMETRIEGETDGHLSAERWVVPETGLLVREASETEVVTAGPVGPVTYTENFTLLLESTRPSR